MQHFWFFARQMLRYRSLLAACLAAAVLDSICAFTGFSTLMWVIPTLLDDQLSLQELARAKLGNPDLQRFIGDQTALAEHLPEDRFNGFVLLMGTILVLAVIGSLFRFIYQYTAITICWRTVMTVRKTTFQRLVHLPMSAVLAKGTADHLARVVRDCSRIARGLNALLGKAVRNALVGTAALLVAITVDWRLTAIFLLSLPVIGVLIRKFGKRIRRASRRAMAQYGRMVGAVQEALQAIRVVKVHQGEGYERRRFNAINRQVWTEEMRARLFRALTPPVVELIAMASVIMVAIVAAALVFRTGGSTNPTDVVNVAAMLGIAGASFRPLANLNNDLQEAAAAATRVHEILQMPVESNARGRGGRRVRRLPRHHATVRFESIGFTYGGADRPALDGIDLEVTQGKLCAVVGANGSGKTTLLALLPRLFDPQVGRILIDGTDIAECSLSSVRRQIAMVTQETVLFEGTIADNLTYGCRHVDEPSMLAASGRSYAHDFITKLPQAYDTHIGEWGGRLSGGQRQRIVIARAILRNPAILILDEATSQIDSDSEAKINEALAELMVDRTTFVVAHRLSTVINANLIVVMDDGRIVDRGTHQQLLERCATYRTLTKTQLQPTV